MSRSLRGGQSKESIEVQKKQMKMGEDQKANCGKEEKMEKKAENKKPELKIEKKDEKTGAPIKEEA